MTKIIGGGAVPLFLLSLYQNLHCWALQKGCDPDHTPLARHFLFSDPTRTKPGSHRYVATESTLFESLKEILPLMGAVSRVHPTLSQTGALEDHCPPKRHTLMGVPTKL